MKNNTIVVPLDGSRFAETAVPAALKMARTFDASLTLVSAYDDEVLVAGYPLDAAGIRTSYADYLDDVTERIGAASNVDVETAVVAGPITKILIEYIQRLQPAMVVMATHGRGPMTRFWLGSVADRMLRYVKMPVLLVRPPETLDEPIDFGQVVEFETVLVPLDGSERAEEGINWARRVCEGAPQFIGLRSVSIPTIASPYLPHTIQETEQTLTAERDEADAYLDRIAKRVAGEGVVLRTDVRTGHSAASAILEATAEHDVDLIVITTHGRTGLARALLGSVADKVIRASPVPVLVVRTVHAPREMDEALVEGEKSGVAAN